MRLIILILMLSSRFVMAGVSTENLSWLFAADFSGIRLSNAKLPIGNDSLIAQMNKFLPTGGGTDEISVAESYSYSLKKLNKDTIEITIICKNFVESIFSENWVPTEKKVIKRLATSEGFCKDFAPIISPQALYSHYKIIVTDDYKNFSKTLESKLRKAYKIKD